MTTKPTNAQLAEWIERGLKVRKFKENPGHYFGRQSDVECGCALTLAAIGKVGLHRVRRRIDKDNVDQFSELVDLLEISAERAFNIEDLHMPRKGSKTAAEIAAMLRRGEIGE